MDIKMLSPSHIFSFSQLSSYVQCPYMFYLRYMQNIPDKISNAYAQSGSLAHDILEKWAKDGITNSEMQAEWFRRYPLEVTEPFPPRARAAGKRLVEDVGDYFGRFKGFGDQYEIVSAESYCKASLNGCRLRGVVDLTLKDKESGKITLIDHKSKSASSIKRDKDAFNQLYVYSYLTKEKLGAYPDFIYYHLFKDSGKLVGGPFSQTRLDEALGWVQTAIMDISMEFNWDPQYDWFFCSNLCDCRGVCEEALRNS